MSPTTETIAQRFEKYFNEADQSVSYRLQDDGFDSPLVGWLTDHPLYKLFLQDALAHLGHEMMKATDTLAREEAADAFLSRIRGYGFDYIKSWSDATRVEFMNKIDEEAEEAKRLDLAEGIDD